MAVDRGHDEDTLVELDTSAAPLLVVRFHGGDQREQLREHLAELSTHVSRRCAVVLITSPRMPFLSAPLATMYADWLIEHENMLRENMAGLALVLSSALARGAFKAVTAMAPLPCPWESFSCEADGLAWARQQLGLSGSGPHLSA